MFLQMDACRWSPARPQQRHLVTWRIGLDGGQTREVVRNPTPGSSPAHAGVAGCCIDQLLPHQVDGCTCRTFLAVPTGATCWSCTCTQTFADVRGHAGIGPDHRGCTSGAACMQLHALRARPFALYSTCRDQFLAESMRHGGDNGGLSCKLPMDAFRPAPLYPPAPPPPPLLLPYTDANHTSASPAFPPVVCMRLPAGCTQMTGRTC